MSNAKKVGRKQKHWIDSETGQPVPGLTRRPDGRWRIIGTHQTFREPNEQKAIAKFRELTAPLADPPSRDGAPLGDIVRGFTLVGGIIGGMSAEDRMYRWIGDQIRARPKLMATKTGVEELGYLKSVKPPERLPSFADLEDIWRDHFKKSAEQKRRVLSHWEDFKTVTGIRSIEDITPEAAIAYRDQVYARDLTPKMQSNIFNRVRRLLTFAKSRAVAIKPLGEAIEALKLLVPNDTPVSFDPHPIERKDFEKLLGKADEEDRAMLLLCLNGAFYLQEVIRLKWSDLRDDGTIVTHRAKSGKIVRVAVLWKETLDALAKVERKGPYIFYNYAGAPLGIKGAELRFRNLREAATVSTDVKSSHLRDGAATAAAEANVNTQLLNLLLGHRSGINDHYVKRNPKMTAPASNAIYAKYLGSEQP